MTEAWRLPLSLPQRVEVALPGRAYEVLVGPALLGEAGSRIAALGARRVGIVTDANLAATHLRALAAALEAAGLKAEVVTVPPGEGSKSFEMFARVVDGLLAARIERKDVVVAFGGGVVGDLAGFAAASLRRGVRFVQIPTSLLAQVDSSVGGKTGINSVHGKNLVGAFHQPSLVIADTTLLDTLPQREVRAGYAEIYKMALIGDAAFARNLEEDAAAVFTPGHQARVRAIATAVAMKAAIVVRDERETGDRALLNLGHTFGHALETEVRYDAARLVHGEAVALGLVLAYRLSARLGHATADDVARVRRHLRAVGLPTRLAEVPGGVGTPERLVAHMFQDKKVDDGRLTFILARGIGHAFIARDVPAGEALAVLEDAFAEG